MNTEQLLKDKLREMALQCDAWARESQTGGWSTHQVAPQKQKAQEIWALLGRVG